MTPTLLVRAKRWARALKRDVLAVWVAARDRRTPMLPKVLALIVAAYALSPIDLIPDFVPVLGYLDDLVLVPLGLMLVVRMIPPGLMAEFRVAAETLSTRPTSTIATTLIVLSWLAAAVFFLGWLILRP
jgi:uncharacterized membrane protein YkvA (DUF1232 family)